MHAHFLDLAVLFRIKFSLDPLNHYQIHLTLIRLKSSTSVQMLGILKLLPRHRAPRWRRQPCETLRLLAAKAARPDFTPVAVVRASVPPPRPSIIGRADFYVRYGEKEREAVASFDFLDEFSSTGSSVEDNLEAVPEQEEPEAAVSCRQSNASLPRVVKVSQV